MCAHYIQREIMQRKRERERRIYRKGRDAARWTRGAESLAAVPERERWKLPADFAGG